MKFGIMHSHINDPTEAVDMAVRAEAAGFDSFWTTDFALGNSPDPLPLLAAASQRTQCILLGTAVMVLPYRHPLLLAKAAATVDALTNGRLILGLGVGATRESSMPSDSISMSEARWQTKSSCCCGCSCPGRRSPIRGSTTNWTE